jgi:hypothetical protein
MQESTSSLKDPTDPPLFHCKECLGCHEKLSQGPPTPDAPDFSHQARSNISLPPVLRETSLLRSFLLINVIYKLNQRALYVSAIAALNSNCYSELKKINSLVETSAARRFAPHVSTTFVLKSTTRALLWPQIAGARLACSHAEAAHCATACRPFSSLRIRESYYWLVSV